MEKYGKIKYRNMGEKTGKSDLEMLNESMQLLFPNSGL